MSNVLIYHLVAPSMATRVQSILPLLFFCNNGEPVSGDVLQSRQPPPMLEFSNFAPCHALQRKTKVAKLTPIGTITLFLSAPNSAHWIVSPLIRIVPNPQAWTTANPPQKNMCISFSCPISSLPHLLPCPPHDTLQVKYNSDEIGPPIEPKCQSYRS